MNIYHSLNLMLDYIDSHLEEDIEFSHLAKILATNEYTMQRLFSMLTNITLREYIRNRRLSKAGYDLFMKQEKIIDIALKYQYKNATSFSRAFYKFYGIKPNQLKKSLCGFKEFPKIHFSEEKIIQNSLHYDIIFLPELVLYGKGIPTTKETISIEAPLFFKRMKQQYSIHKGFEFGMVVYENRIESCNFEYWVLSREKIPGFKPYIILASSYLVFHISTDDALDIQKVSRAFYESFFPNCPYYLRNLPELEYYHDGVTDFLIPVEN